MVSGSAPNSGIYLDTTIGASLAAGVSGAVEAGAYVEGGMEATLALTLADQQHDEFDGDPEKVRLGLELGSDLFNIEGSIGGEIAFGVEAGVEINGKFVGYQVEHVLASGEIATFETSIIPNPFEKTPAESVVLAEFNEATGVLHLYAGADAGLRSIDPTESHEQFFIAVQGGNLEITFQGATQTINAPLNDIQLITANFGVGADGVHVASNVDIDVEFYGGSGADELVYEGSGQAVLLGENGADTLTGGAGSNFHLRR